MILSENAGCKIEFHNEMPLSSAAIEKFTIMKAFTNKLHL